ncbi:MAG: hypothetical protein ACRD4G_00150 [Bryobacteraceae bacterium]
MNVQQPSLRVWLVVLAALLFILSPTPGLGAGSDSAYSYLYADAPVTGTGDTFDGTYFNVSQAEWVLVRATGRYYPNGGTFIAVYITIDGNKVSNDAVTDWRGSTDPTQHSYDVIGVAYLTPGSHLILVEADAPYGYVNIGAGSNFSIMTQPASSINQYIINSDTGIISENVTGIQEGTPLPVTSIANATTTTGGEPIIALASGRSYYAGTPPNNYGDAMWNLSIDGVGEHNNSSSWSDNDMFTGAELQAPMYNQGFFNTSPGQHKVSLDATAEPYGSTPDNVWYRVGAGSRLILLNGGMTVAGKVTPDTQVNHRFDYRCIGSSQGWPGCPSTGTDVVLDDVTISIPQGHNGVVMFSGMTRVQGDTSDGGGNVSIWITIDGVPVSSHGVQQLDYPNGDSTRTICTSYLAAGSNALSPGNHDVQLHAEASGGFIHLSVTQDLPLIWFD